MMEIFTEAKTQRTMCVGLSLDVEVSEETVGVLRTDREDQMCLLENFIEY